MVRFTKEQFDQIGPFHIDDVPVLQDKDQDYMLRLFNILPESLKGLAVSKEFL